LCFVCVDFEKLRMLWSMDDDVVGTWKCTEWFVL
jgi:hypothetical protein